MLALSRTSVAVLAALKAAAGLESRDQGYVNMVYWLSW